MCSDVVELISIQSSCKHLSGCQTVHVHWLLYMDLLQFQSFFTSETSMLSVSVVPIQGLDYVFEFDFLINTVGTSGASNDIYKGLFYFHVDAKNRNHIHTLWMPSALLCLGNLRECLKQQGGLAKVIIAKTTLSLCTY